MDDQSKEVLDRFGHEESQTIEFKEALPRDLEEVLVAFTNAIGGTVLIGVTNSGQVQGLNWTQIEEERLQEHARKPIPPLSLDTELFTLANGRRVVAVKVTPLRETWAHTANGRLVVRAGPTNRVLVGEELKRFLASRTSSAAESAAAGSDVSDLNLQAIRGYLERRGIDPARDVTEALKSLNLVTPQGQPTLAAVLLFGNEPQGNNPSGADRRRLTIEVHRYDGVQGQSPKLRDRVELSGTSPELIAQADKWVYDHMRRDAVVRGLIREEVPEYPPVALREALVNSIGHRDYSLHGAAVQVRLYDDCIEIESPGALAGYVNLENLRTAQYSRNPKVMDAFHTLGLVEESGSGIDRMYTEMENALLDDPQFFERAGSFMVRFPGRSVFAAEDRLWISDVAPMSLSSEAKIAMVFAHRHGSVTNEDLRVLRPKLSAAEARASLRGLVAAGLMEPVGRGRGTRYELTGSATRSRVTTLQARVDTLVSHARRAGFIVIRDVQSLLGITEAQARDLIEAAVAGDLLRPEGEKSARRYVPASPDSNEATKTF